MTDNEDITPSTLAECAAMVDAIRKLIGDETDMEEVAPDAPPITKLEWCSAVDHLSLAYLHMVKADLAYDPETFRARYQESRRNGNRGN